jgi:hypothetical protein
MRGEQANAADLKGHSVAVDHHGGADITDLCGARTATPGFDTPARSQQKRRSIPGSPFMGSDTT